MTRHDGSLKTIHRKALPLKDGNSGMCLSGDDQSEVTHPISCVLLADASDAHVSIGQVEPKLGSCTHICACSQGSAEHYLLWEVHLRDTGQGTAKDAAECHERMNSKGLCE